MGLSASDAYAQIKNLENSGQLVVPEPQDTVVIGTVDAGTGTFAWAVPTVQKSVTSPPPPGGGGPPTNTVTNSTLGVVFTKAVDLRIQLNVVPKKPVEGLLRETASPPTAPSTGILQEKVTPAIASGAALSTAGTVLGSVSVNLSGVTVSGFPTVSTTASSITFDVGLAGSAPLGDDENGAVTPAITSLAVAVNVPGFPAISVEFYVLRPPAVTLGAFTIPALPVAIVYAPPQGKLLKNTATYSDTTTVTQTVTTAVTTSKNTKTAQAYSVGDLIGKVASAITTVAGVAATGGAGGGGGASVVGALSELGSAVLGGGAQQAVDSTVDASKQLSANLSLVSGVLSGLDASAAASDAGTINEENDQSVSIAVSSMSLYGSAAGLGPGVGDRIVYFSNVRVLWSVLNGDLGISVIGFDGVGANAVRDLLDEQAHLAAGNPARLGLDAATIKSLLALDPLVPSTRPVEQHVGPAVVGPPRYVPASPKERSGTSTTSMGDQFAATIDTTDETKTVTTNIQTTITDVKPGWAAVLFGADNVETTTTLTLTNARTVDDKTEDKITVTITMYSQDDTDRYDVKIFTDNMFGTYAVLDANSPLLKGSPVTTVMA